MDNDTILKTKHVEAPLSTVNDAGNVNCMHKIRSCLYIVNVLYGRVT